MKGKNTWDIKLIAIALVLGFPLMGAYLLHYALSIGDDIIMYIGLVVLLLFPLATTYGILRPKRKR